MRAAAEREHHNTAFAMLVPGASVWRAGAQNRNTLGECRAGLGRKAERNKRTDEVQHEEFVCVTDRFP